MKLWIAMLSVLLMVSAPNLTYIDEIDHDELPITFHVINQEMTPDFVAEETEFMIEYTVSNEHAYSIKEVTLTVDTYLDDVFVEQIEIVIPIDVIHHSYQVSEYEEVFERFYFDEIEIVSFDVVEMSFLQSYRTTISLAIFYGMLIFLMWMFIDIYKWMTTYEVKQILRDYWWAVLIITFLFPAIISALSFLGRYYVLTQVYGWIFFMIAPVSVLFFYIVLRIYHAIKDRI